jgi:hypothetical protein
MGYGFVGIENAPALFELGSGYIENRLGSIGGALPLG